MRTSTSGARGRAGDDEYCCLVLCCFHFARRYKAIPPFCRDEASLDQAITMNGTHLRGRPLRVSYGQAKKPKVSAFQAAALQLAEGLGD